MMESPPGPRCTTSSPLASPPCGVNWLISYFSSTCQRPTSRRESFFISGEGLGLPGAFCASLSEPVAAGSSCLGGVFVVCVLPVVTTCALAVQANATDVVIATSHLICWSLLYM